MKLKKLTDRVWITPFEDARDRPSLGYLRGDRYSLAVDAGHSKAHVEEFYAALEAEGLPLPALTVLTHWHWDHSFGLHAVRGVTAAGERTQAHLKEVLDRWQERGGGQYFKHLDPHIALEYGEEPIHVCLADLTLREELALDPGGLPVRCFPLPSPHTDDCTFLLAPQEGVLFVGDAVCGPYPSYEDNLEKRQELIAALAALDFRLAVGGHWEVYTKRSLMEDLEDGIV